MTDRPLGPVNFEQGPVNYFFLNKKNGEWEKGDAKDAPGTKSALEVQEGGDHYRKLKIQPVEYIHANGLPFIEGNIVKYITRWRDKNGLEDLKKVRHYIDLLIELETRCSTPDA